MLKVGVESKCLDFSVSKIRETGHSSFPLFILINFSPLFRFCLSSSFLVDSFPNNCHGKWFRNPELLIYKRWSCPGYGIGKWREKFWENMCSYNLALNNYATIEFGFLGAEDLTVQYSGPWTLPPRSACIFKRNINTAHTGQTAIWLDGFILQQTVSPWVETWAKGQETPVQFPVK